MSSVLMGWDRFAELPRGCKGGGVCERPHTPPPLHPRGPRVWCIIPYTFPTTSRVMHNPLTLLVLLSIRKVLKESPCPLPVSYTHLRAHETDSYLVCRLLLEK